jgi:phosphate transport system substrate-binding protein
MKRITLVFLLASLAMQAAAQKISQGRVIKITGTRLTHPLVQRWIDEYSKQHPGIVIQLTSKIPADSADIVIASYSLKPADVKEGRVAVALNRYIQLPVINKQHNQVGALQSKGFTDADFRRIYFANDNTGPLAQFAVYKREKPACASIAFANHFGNEQKDIKGIGVNGDDRDLLNAVKRDSNGISYNNLGFIYDLKNRRIVDSIAVVPIDFNENGRIDDKEQIYGTLDQVLQFAEKTPNPKLLIEHVNVIIRKNEDSNVVGFLQWILTKGQQFNHAYGFIGLEPSVIQAETRLLTSLLPAHACVNSGQLIKSRFAVK